MHCEKGHRLFALATSSWGTGHEHYHMVCSFYEPNRQMSQSIGSPDGALRQSAKSAGGWLQHSTTTIVDIDCVSKQCLLPGGAVLYITRINHHIKLML